MNSRKSLDPRAGIWLLFLANIGMFLQKNTTQGSILTSIFLLFLLGYGQYKASLKGALLLIILRLLLKFVFPICPVWINMVFPLLANYTLRMLPCILAGLLFLRTSSMQEIIAAMRKCRFPQGFIIAIATTFRYFPTIKEEFAHIRAAMKLQSIPLSSRFECTIVPLMISAVNTSDEIAAAAVARGIENPCSKSSAVEISMVLTDWIVMILGTVAVVTILLAV